MQPFTAEVIRVIQAIPEGQVMTYGQVASFAGSPRGARQVVRILHTQSKIHQLPWHRVVNRLGEIVIQNDEGQSMQRLLLESEGVEFTLQGRVDLNTFGLR
ncbi:methylated-DNA-protein-cysteine methyltransferase-like protein [Paenibacillus shirakamiensis]|uniref:Methylated-DNA-protein-cysteine methyltransferase-like protein n=1 Tax=Paenibacillus shirakamiensis TaxID=1265935 RepID=A0ABS4JLJ9_9BACL|nr:MGMT family protein [Paenibacillus shirakamiensis]MBP2001970.1 methylated-DNA-protein-cysteine methyltransferase-like protein [Paenibacillus shirakamiensis]